ncbi:MAG: protein-glutamate O-methyltransferase CheR, partial [Desulfobacterales bacterium]|nr:protein-glutamate O-methyltransferase CheR [Desulfobacterales bacterium]
EICTELRTVGQEKKKLRIWSAGCASGEEPYTIAMVLMEQEKEFKDWEIEIVGSDINQRVLHTARGGFYRRNS